MDGLIRALDRIDDVVDLVRKAKDTADAKAILMSSEYEMSDAQASAILALTLGRSVSEWLEAAALPIHRPFHVYLSVYILTCNVVCSLLLSPSIK